MLHEFEKRVEWVSLASQELDSVTVYTLRLVPLDGEEPRSLKYISNSFL